MNVPTIESMIMITGIMIHNMILILSKCIHSPRPSWPPKQPFRHNVLSSPIHALPKFCKGTSTKETRMVSLFCLWRICLRNAGVEGMRQNNAKRSIGTREYIYIYYIWTEFEIVSQVFDVGCRMDRADLVEPALTASTWGCHFGKRRLLQTFWWSVAWISSTLGALVDERRNQLCKQLSNIDSYLWAVGIQKGTPDLHWTSTILRSETMPLMIAHAKLGIQWLNSIHAQYSPIVANVLSISQHVHTSPCHVASFWVQAGRCSGKRAEPAIWIA